MAGATVAPTTAGATRAPDQPATTTPPSRVVSEADPLELWIIGDSFLELFGPALVNRSTDTGVIDADVDFRYVSGLSRPDFFDWPVYVAGEAVVDGRQDVAVALSPSGIE